jgi:hypothetical protein
MDYGDMIVVCFFGFLAIVELVYGISKKKNKHTISGVVVMLMVLVYFIRKVGQ